MNSIEVGENREINKIVIFQYQIVRIYYNILMLHTYRVKIIKYRKNIEILNFLALKIFYKYLLSVVQLGNIYFFFLWGENKKLISKKQKKRSLLLRFILIYTK